MPVSWADWKTEQDQQEDRIGLRSSEQDWLIWLRSSPPLARGHRSACCPDWDRRQNQTRRGHERQRRIPGELICSRPTKLQAFYSSLYKSVQGRRSWGTCAVHQRELKFLWIKTNNANCVRMISIMHAWTVWLIDELKSDLWDLTRTLVSFSLQSELSSWGRKHFLRHMKWAGISTKSGSRFPQNTHIKGPWTAH